MDGTEVFAEANRRQVQVLEDLRALVEVESPSSELEALHRSASSVKEILERRLPNGSHTLLEIEEQIHVRMRWGHRQPRVLVLAHHDTVWPTGTIQRLPWSVEDGIIRGPGVLDMKLGLIQAIHALAILHEYTPTGLDGVTLLVTGDEELGSPSSRELIEQEATGCVAVFVLEAAGDGGELKTARKGVSQYTVEVIGRASHAGLAPEAGINAGVELAHQILNIVKLADTVAGTTVTPTVLGGGSTDNTVPARAHVAVDVRAWSLDEQNRVDTAIRRFEPVSRGATVQVRGGVNRPPLEENQSRSLCERAQSLARTAGIREPSAAAVGGASDGNFTGGLGVPTLDGLGGVGGGAHADTEHARVEYISERVTLLTLLLHDTLNGGNPK